MAVFSNVGDSVVTPPIDENVPLTVTVTGTFDMRIALQREQGSPGSGAFQDVVVWLGSDPINDVYFTRQEFTRYRLIATDITSGVANGDIVVGLAAGTVTGAVTSVVTLDGDITAAQIAAAINGAGFQTLTAAEKALALSGGSGVVGGVTPGTAPVFTANGNIQVPDTGSNGQFWFVGEDSGQNFVLYYGADETTAIGSGPKFVVSPAGVVNVPTGGDYQINGVTIQGGGGGGSVDSVAGVSPDGTGDVPVASLVTAVDANPDTNFLTDAERAKLAAVEANATADQIAAEVPISAITNIAATNVQGALAELQGDIDGLAGGHPDDDVETVTGTAVDNTDARNPVIDNPVATDVAVTPASGVAANNVQFALEEISTEAAAAQTAANAAQTTANTAATNAATNATAITTLQGASHADDDVEGVTGAVVDNTDPRNPVINAVPLAGTVAQIYELNASNAAVPVTPIGVLSSSGPDLTGIDFTVSIDGVAVTGLSAVTIGTASPTAASAANVGTAGQVLRIQNDATAGAAGLLGAMLVPHGFTVINATHQDGEIHVRFTKTGVYA